MSHWTYTGKKATDRTTGAKLLEQQSTVTSTTRWEVSLDGKVLGHVRSYVGNVDKKAPGSRIAYSRTEKIMWVSEPVRAEGQPRPRPWYRHATRARAAQALVKY